MNVLDASVLIAHLDAGDIHHTQATDLLIELVDEPLLISSLTLAECYVGPARNGELAKVVTQVGLLDIQIVGIDGPDAERLAELRAHTGLRMPDCCVLLAAESEGAGVATFDGRLGRAARSLGIEVRPDLSDTPGS